jgi:hypothetical protein
MVMAEPDDDSEDVSREREQKRKGCLKHRLNSDPLRGEIPNIRIMYNDIEHSISIDFYIYISIFQVF